jgi:hypothetical protein
MLSWLIFVLGLILGSAVTTCLLTVILKQKVRAHEFLNTALLALVLVLIAWKYWGGAQ